jgi:hypothetical protein
VNVRTIEKTKAQGRAGRKDQRNETWKERRSGIPNDRERDIVEEKRRE